MPHLTPTDARVFNLHGVTFTSYASSASGAGELAAWRADFQPHTPGQEHVVSHEEIFYVLDGTLEVSLDGQAYTAASGDVVVIPAGSAFCAGNATEAPASAWVSTRLGLTAVMPHGGEQVTPPWAQ